MQQTVSGPTMDARTRVFADMTGPFQLHGFNVQKTIGAGPVPFPWLGFICDARKGRDSSRPQIAAHVP